MVCHWGIDPVVLTDKLISDIDWLSVYKVPRVKGKVKLKHVRLELYNNCMRLHQKEHQEIPVNNKLWLHSLEPSPTSIAKQ